MLGTGAFTTRYKAFDRCQIFRQLGLNICLRDLLLRRMMETGGTMKIAK
jgi:hypothetical protein